MVLFSSGRKTALNFLLVNLTLAKPKAKSMLLSNLISSLIANHKVLRASLTTSDPRQAAEAIGTGLA